jgi:hypothetical protein
MSIKILNFGLIIFFYQFHLELATTVVSKEANIFIKLHFKNSILN